MKNLFVGQKVRIVGTDYYGNPKHNPTGLTGIIRAEGSFVGAYSGNLYRWQVWIGDDHGIFANSDELEPILDPPELADPAEFAKFLEDNKYREEVKSNA